MVYWIILYFSVNFLITLIWFIIPGWVNIHRQEYGLPPKSVWPIPAEFFECSRSSDVSLTVVLGVICMLTVPGVIIYCVYEIFCRICHWAVGGVAFSKEEKVQIAVGTIEKGKGKG